MSGEPRADVGVFGGSGFYDFLHDAERIHLDTPYGAPSGPVVIGDIGGCTVAFLARHGERHEFPPHRVNYRANAWVMHELGVSRVIGPAAAGSLRPDVHPGDIVVCDQLIDRTSGRPDTFIEGPDVAHVSFSDPYCAELRPLVARAATEAGANVHPEGTVVVISGPRFSTRAESRWFASMGGDVVNMTQYPEAYLSRELGICYAGIALVTDYDAGLEGRPDVGAVTTASVLEVLGRNVERVRDVLRLLIPTIPARTTACGCAESLVSASIST